MTRSRVTWILRKIQIISLICADTTCGRPPSWKIWTGENFCAVALTMPRRVLRHISQPISGFSALPRIFVVVMVIVTHSSPTKRSRDEPKERLWSVWEAMGRLNCDIFRAKRSWVRATALGRKQKYNKRKTKQLTRLPPPPLTPRMAKSGAFLSLYE